MKRVIVDTNVVIDVLASREPWRLSGEKIFLEIANEQIEGCLTASTITDIYYLIRKYLQSDTLAKNAIGDLVDLFTILDVTSEDCVNALSLKVKDFEDALIVSIAKRNGIDIIITRNVKDYLSSGLMIITPDDYIG